MALGVVGLTFGDFCILTFDEFEAVIKAYREKEIQRQQGDWERMRLHAAMTIQPHCRHKIDPKKLLPFDWEKRSGKTRNSVSIPDKEDAKNAFLRRIESMKKKG